MDTKTYSLLAILSGIGQFVSYANTMPHLYMMHKRSLKLANDGRHYPNQFARTFVSNFGADQAVSADIDPEIRVTNQAFKFFAAY